jgi:molybdate transport system ATP-binding protein
MIYKPSVLVDIKRRMGSFELDVRFQSEAGLTALFGRSGSGKTSIINMLAGLDRPDSGTVSLDGTTLFSSEENIDQKTEQRRIGYVFQDSRLFPHMNVLQNLNYGTRFIPKHEPKPDLDAVIDLLGLAPLLNRRSNALSGGEKQRVAIGRALMVQPRLLLMDEPLASVDSGRKDEIISFIENLRDQLKIPIVYVSHAMDEVIRLADTLVILDDGVSVASGSVEEIMSRLDLRPLTGRYEAGAVIPAVLIGHDHENALSELGFANRSLLVPRLNLYSGESLRVRIRARDVSLSRNRPEQSSFLNIFDGAITEISSDEGAQVEVLLDIGVPLIARITKKSMKTLELQVGDRIFAMVKTAAIDRHSMGRVGMS